MSKKQGGSKGRAKRPPKHRLRLVAPGEVRVSGDSMIGAGIFPGSILVVDRAVEAGDGDIVVARLGGELVLKWLSLDGGRVRLLSDNDDYPPVEVADDADFEVWGCVMHSIRSHREVPQ